MATDTASSITRRIIDNIVEWASELQHAARELSLMDSGDQARVWNDLSGDEGRRRTFGADGREHLSSELYEPTDVVEGALRDLSDELDKMPSRKKRAMDRATEISPDYVKNRAFRMRFLRTERFDARLAAVRMALHFEAKRELFGEDRLAREIFLSDLDEDDMESLRSGYLQVLSELDFGYRKVIFYYKALTDCYKQRENLLRSFWWFANSISSNEDVQKLGVVNVVYNLGGFPKSGIDYEKSRRLAGLFKAIPMRFCAFYPCIDTRAWAVVVDTFSVIISKFLRVRLRVIKGDHEEVLLKLKAVGIPSEALPVNDESELQKEGHLAWIDDQRMREEVEREPPRKRPRAQRGRQAEEITDLLETTPSPFRSKDAPESSSFYAVG